MPLGALGELQGGHLHYPILFGGKGNVYALVNGEAGNLSKIMVRMGPDGADPIGAEGDSFWIPTVYFFKSLFAMHYSNSSFACSRRQGVQGVQGVQDEC